MKKIKKIKKKVNKKKSERKVFFIIQMILMS